MDDCVVLCPSFFLLFERVKECQIWGVHWDSRKALEEVCQGQIRVAMDCVLNALGEGEKNSPRLLKYVELWIP